MSEIVKFEAFRGVDLSAGIAFARVDQAMDAAEVFAASSLVPKALQGKPRDVLLVLLKGAELGLKPLQALSEIHIVDGKAGVSAKLKMALCLQRPECEFFVMVASTAEKAVYRAKRKGAPEPVEYSYSIEDAKRAGLTHKQNWQNHPAAMLRARCSSGLADSVFPDLCQGVMTHDELREVEERVVGTSSTPLATVAPVIPPPVAVAPPWGETDVPRPTPPGEKTVDAVDPVETLRVRIGLAATTKDLTAMVAEIKALPTAAQETLRPLYTRRSNELAGVRR